MENSLIKLKRILIAMTDKELKEMDLWINNEREIKAFAVDDTAISIFTESADLKVNGRNW